MATTASNDGKVRSLSVNIGTSQSPKWYVISSVRNPSANLSIAGLEFDQLQLFLSILEAGAQLQQRISGLESDIEYYDTRYWFETFHFNVLDYRRGKIFDLKEGIASLEGEFAELSDIFDSLGFGNLIVSGRARSRSPDMFLLQSSGRGLSAAIDAMRVSLQEGGGSGATKDYPAERALRYAAEWVLYGRIFRAVGAKLGGRLAKARSLDDLPIMSRAQVKAALPSEYAKNPSWAYSIHDHHFYPKWLGGKDLGPILRVRDFEHLKDLEPALFAHMKRSIPGLTQRSSEQVRRLIQRGQMTQDDITAALFDFYKARYPSLADDVILRNLDVGF